MTAPFTALFMLHYIRSHYISMHAKTQAELSFIHPQLNEGFNADVGFSVRPMQPDS